jgi:putative protease
MPSSIEQINEIMDSIDGVIVGLDKLCINMPVNFNKKQIFEIIDICNQNNKEIFISLNKNMFNSDLAYLKEILLELDKEEINGIMHYDIAIVNIKEELSLKTALVWNQEHLTTNYLTSNYWYDFGAKYTYLSSEITIDEINEIKEKASAKLMVTLFGYLPMFVSRRHLVKNYLDTFDLKDDSKINILEKEGNKYQIIDSEDGTVAYSSHILNGITEVLNTKVDYMVLNSFSIEDEKFKEVVYMFKTVSTDNVNDYKGENRYGARREKTRGRA